MIGPLSNQSYRGNNKTQLSITESVANRKDVLDPLPMFGCVHTTKDIMLPENRVPYYGKPLGTREFNLI